MLFKHLYKRLPREIVMLVIWDFASIPMDMKVVQSIKYKIVHNVKIYFIHQEIKSLI